MNPRLLACSSPLLLIIACKPAAPAAESTSPDATAAKPSDPAVEYGPLEVGSDWQTYTKINKEPLRSPDHGNRFVDTYVNDVGLSAYLDTTGDTPMPVGSIVVKTSFQPNGDEPGAKEGPIFVMEKRAEGYDEEHEDWYFAIHWAEPTEKLAARFGGPFYWRSPSSKVDYCWGCHEAYDRYLGGVEESDWAEGLSAMNEPASE